MFYFWQSLFITVAARIERFSCVCVPDFHQHLSGSLDNFGTFLE
jgi:hypothetical protein